MRSRWPWQKIVFQTAKKSTTRNPPFELELDFDQYRRGREYQSKSTTILSSIN